MSKIALPIISHGVRLPDMNDLLSRLINMPSRLHRIRVLLSLFQTATGEERAGLIIAQSPDIIYWADHTEHPDAIQEDDHVKHPFTPLIAWAENQPAGYAPVTDVADLPLHYNLTGVMVLRDRQDLTAVILLTGTPSIIPDDEGFEGLLNILTLIAMEQRTTNNLNTFLNDFAHDQRNILNVVTMAADMLYSSKSLPEKAQGHLTRIFDNSMQIGNQIENALSVDRYDPETDEYHMIFSQVELVELRREICDRYYQVAHGKRITIKTPHVRGRIYLVADQGMITRAITNLVENALKFTPDGGQIEVMLSKTENAAQIAVKDNGPGIAPENIDRIFDRKVRIRQAKQVRGLGLGLFIVRNVARKHGGRTWAESTQGEGSTFYLSLPLKPPHNSAK